MNLARLPLLLVLCATVAACASACDQTTPTGDDPEAPDPADPPPTVTQRGARILGIAISDRTDGDFNTAYLQAVDAGMQSTSIPLAWDDAEVSPGVYAPSPDFLAIGNDFYGSRGTEVMLGINPIDTNNRRVPAHLDGLAWDDPLMVAAFKQLLDWAVPKTVGLDVTALAIGNEIDGTLASTDEWAAYARFFEQVAEHARQLRPGLRVGSKVQFNGLVGTFAAEAAALNEHADVVLTTYYPLGAGFQILAPGTVHGVFDDVVARYPQRTILFAEIGSSSTTRCGSSEDLQAEFIREAFAAWDRHADQIEMLEWVWMHDISDDAVTVYESYYGLSDVCFLDYLATLGLKHPNGSDKPAWQALVAEAEARGW